MSPNPNSEIRSNRRPTSMASSMVTQQVYDVIVLGPQLAGTVAGGLLAKRGYRVLHVDPEGLGGWYEDKSYRLPYAPAVFPSLRSLPQAEAALTELGVAIDLDRTMRAAPSALQLLFPRNRLDFPADPALRLAEVAREFPADQPAVASALQSTAALAEATDPFFRLELPLPPDGFFERRAVKKAAGAHPQVVDGDAALRSVEQLPVGEALRALGRFLAYLEDGEGSGLARARPLSQLLSGTFRFPGGALGLREALRKRLAELGGDLLGDPAEPASIEELIFEGDELTGVKLASNRNIYRARYVVAAMDVDHLAALVPPKARRRKFSDLFESARARRFLFPVNLVVKTEGLPMGLKDLALLLPRDEELGPVLLEVLPAYQGDREVPGERVLCAAAYVSSAERDAGEKRMRELARRIEDVALSVAPFVEPYVVARSAPYLDAKNSRNRLAPHPLFEVAEHSFLGFAGLPHRTPCRNLFLANREVLPGLGIEGEFMAGMRAAGLVQEALKKHNPLK